MFYVFALLTIALVYAYFHNRKVKHSYRPINKLSLFIETKKRYLRSTIWQSKRRAVLKRDSYTCQCCGATNTMLHVHHMSYYKLIPYEPLTSLVTLCADCHTKQHQFYGYPQTLSDYMNWNAPLKKD